MRLPDIQFCFKFTNDSFQRTNNCLSKIFFTKNGIAKIIKNIDPYRAHGHDMINIRVVKQFRSR